MTQYLVGFDRFVALDWANFAMELAANASSDSDGVPQLKEWLSIRIAGKDSIRKTANVLARLWLATDADAMYFRTKALELVPDSSPKDHVLFHWGMAVLMFPFFRDTCIQIGRLGALQTTITRKAIRARILEKYSNQSTIPRSVDRIFQTLLDWELLTNSGEHGYSIASHASANTNAKKWLLEAAVFSSSNRRAAINGLYRLPELFPFELNGEVRPLLQGLANVRIERDGSEIEYAAWEGGRSR